MTATQTDHGSGAPLRVVIAGAGVAGLETLIALREMADDRVQVTLVSPEDDFVYRPLSVGEPFALGPARRIPVAQLVRDFHAKQRREGLASVDPDAHTVTLANGDSLAYDKPGAAVGAKREPGTRRSARGGRG
jgi:sulfide:quinone oxidoreductase